MRLRRATTLPPGVLWQKLRTKLARKLGQGVHRIQARWPGIQLSDKQFSHALSSNTPSIQSFLREISVRQKPVFFVQPNRRHEWMTALQAACPQAGSKIIIAADQVCAHIFDLLGSGPTPLGQQIDWHTDFKSKYRWNPRQFYSDIRPAPHPGGYDIKIPWELSRCQHFAWLGQAYWLTGNEKYAQEFVTEVLDWIAHNPPLVGVNWNCTMDVAIRTVNWLWGYAFFQNSPAITDNFRLQFFKSLLLHGRHIIRNLEWSESLTSNHYLTNIVGLVYLGILLPELKEPRQWREFSLNELEKEMFKQVYQDGVDFEGSTSYHRLVTELFLSATLLAQLNGHKFSNTYMQRLEKMIEFIMALSRPDGCSPLIGDNDNGRLHRLKIWEHPEREWSDFRYLLAIGALMFERDDFTQAACDQWEEAIWMFGEKAFRARQETYSPRKQSLPLPSQAFPNTGIYILRHNDFHLTVDAGGNGQNGNGGHAHNDTLSFELYMNDQAWIVDPGTSTYTANYFDRNLSRSTGMHNTIVIDRREHNQYAPDQLFRMENDVTPLILQWKTEPHHLKLAACFSYSDFDSSIGAVDIQRFFHYDIIDMSLTIQDTIKGQGSHLAEWYFHMAPRVEIHPLDYSTLRLMKGDANLILSIYSDIPLNLEIDTSWISPGYGQKNESKVLKCGLHTQLPLQVTFAWKPDKPLK